MNIFVMLQPLFDMLKWLLPSGEQKRSFCESSERSERC